MLINEIQLKHIMGELLKQNGYFKVNKRLMSALGISKATILSACIDRWNFVGCKEFYYRLSDLATLTRQNEKTIRRDMQELVEEGFLIKGRLKGAPPKQYYDINIQKLASVLATPCEIDYLEKELEKELEIEKSMMEKCPMEQNPTLPILESLTLPILGGINIPNSVGIYNKNKEYKNKVIRTNTNAHASDALVAPANAEGLECAANQHKPKSKRASEPTDEQLAAFEIFWERYPKRNKKQPALVAFLKALSGKAARGRFMPKGAVVTPELIMQGLEQWIAQWKREGKEKGSPYIPDASTWLNDMCYLDTLEASPTNGRDAIAQFNQKHGLKGDSAVKGYYNLPRHMQEEIEGNWRDFLPKTEEERKANELAVKRALGLEDEE